MQPDGSAPPWGAMPQQPAAGAPVLPAQPVAQPMQAAPQAIPMTGQVAYQQPVMMAGQAQMMVMESPPKQLLVGILLALFVGTLGIHNFYLGHTGRGIAQLLITVLTFGIGALITWPWSLIELIMMATGNLNDADGRPLA
jgi:TM2 domain-containing membrane protein YozV